MQHAEPAHDETKTVSFTVPPPVETPAAWEVARPRYFGVTPHGFAAVLAAFAFGAAIALLFSGYPAAGGLLLVAAVLLMLVFAEQARRRRASALDRVAAAAADRTRALAGLAGSSLRAWTGAGRRVASLRLEANRLARRRAQLQYALGGAVHAGDEAETARLQQELTATDERIAACIGQAGEVVAGARRVTARERFAVAETEVRPSGDAQS